MNKFYVYAIYNRVNNKIYIGQTEDIERRLREHNDPKSLVHTYTRQFSGDWELIYKEEVLSRKGALTREKQLKSFRGREFIKSHIPR